MKTFFTSYEGYMNSSGVSQFEGETTKEALINAINVHQYGIDEDEEFTEQELLAKINDNDGCDYIISIISSEGELIYECE